MCRRRREACGSSGSPASISRAVSVVTGYLLVVLTVALTVVAQVLIKWQVDRAGALPADWPERLTFALRLVGNPWVIAAFALAAVAAVAYMVALTRLEVSRAYPVMSLSFAAVLLFSSALFGEALTIAKVAGVLLILLGVLVGIRG